MKILMYITKFFIGISFCFKFASLSYASDEYTLTFFAQIGSAPDRIEIESSENKVSDFKFSSGTNTATIPISQFYGDYTSFFVTVYYDDDVRNNFEIRLLRPKEGSRTREKSFYLVEPGRFFNGNYTDAVKKSRRLLKTNRRKAFVPYFFCQEAYWKADELGDKQTAIDALTCWLEANHRLVFADASTTRQMVAPDLGALEAFSEVLNEINSGDFAWNRALSEAAVSRNQLKKFAEMAQDIRLSHWVFFPEIQQRLAHEGNEVSCTTYSKFKKEYRDATEAVRQHLAGPRFAIEFEMDSQRPQIVSMSMNCGISTDT